MGTRDGFEVSGKQKDLKTAIECRCYRTENGKTTMRGRQYISGVDKSAEEFYLSLRGHWSIENGLHGSLDVIFREDGARASKDHEMRESEYPVKDGAGASSGGAQPAPVSQKEDDRPQTAVRRFHQPGLYVDGHLQ